MRRLLVLVFALLASCDPREVDFALPVPADSGSAEAIPGLQALQITPEQKQLSHDGSAAPRRLLFRAIGSFADGKRDVTARVAWSLARPELGSIAAGRFESAAVGGETEVRVTAGDVSAVAKLQVQLDVVRSREGASQLMAAFASEAEGSPSLALALVYPGADAVVPSDLTRMRFQWAAPAEFDAFELSLETKFARVRYYTRERDWLDDADTSRFFAPSAAGEGVRLRVRALSRSTPRAVLRSEVVEVQVAAAPLPGDVLYWSSTARGIKRGSFASGRSRLEANLAGGDACVGCHALSRDGTRLAVANGEDRLEIFEGPQWTAKVWPETMPAAPMMPPGTQKGAMAMAPMMPMPKRGPAEYGWASFSPDGSQLVYAAKGKLRVIGSETGLEVPKFRLPPETSVSHPDWSPDGGAIAVSYAMGKASKSNKLVRGSAIAVLQIQPDGMFGEPETLVPSRSPDDTLTFPVYSPDGRWLAYSHANGASKDNPRAQLWIVAADGSSAPVLLERANRPVDPAATQDVANNMPTWAPASGDKLGFIAFSSTRDYGNVFAGVQRDQLWVSAIDFAALEAGRDPSAPAFWLPFQDPAESNHRALWAPASTPVEQECASTFESCGDDADNDCDGAINEGCDCDTVDICDNGMDDDCDQHTDEDCKD